MIATQRYPSLPIDDPDDGAALVGASFAAQNMRAALGPLSRSSVNMVLCGEPGVGKRNWVEALARHAGGSAAPLPVLQLNGHAEEQIEDVFFRADDGSCLASLPSGTIIYIEAVDALPPRLQTRFAEWLCVRQRWPVRVIGATTIPLDELVRRGRFSGALHAVLGVVQLRIPPLRDRRMDIGPIADHLIRRHRNIACPGEPVLDPGALAQLRDHTWPGNVRELVTVLRAVVSLAPEGPLTAERVRAALGPRRGRRRDPSEILPLEQIESDYIVLAVERAGGNQALAARLLGIGRSTLIRKLKQARAGGAL
jgi:two-component system, NtrC family, response regulator HydG